VNISFENELAETVLVELIDITGKTVLKEKYNPPMAFEAIKVNTAGILSGYYILRVSQNEETLLRSTLIIKH
jgi:hypothetical protein